MSNAPMAASTGNLPGIVPATVVRTKAELASFFRNKQSLVFTLALPVLLMLVFGMIFKGKIDGTNVDFKQVFLAGIIASGVMATSFTGLAINVALEREMGLLRRIAASPMPRSAYFIGKVVRVVVTTIVEVAILMVLAVTVFHLELPSDSMRWGVLAWVTALGVSSCSLAGIAYTALIPNARSASAIVTPPFMVLQFISGVFYPFNLLPETLQKIALAFPLAWLCRGYRYVFLPDEFRVTETGGTWDLPMIAIMLGGWTVLGMILTFVVFRWRGPRVR